MSEENVIRPKFGGKKAEIEFTSMSELDRRVMTAIANQNLRTLFSNHNFEPIAVAASVTRLYVKGLIQPIDGEAELTTDGEHVWDALR